MDFVNRLAEEFKLKPPVRDGQPPMKKKKSAALLIGAILGTLCILYVYSYMSKSTGALSGDAYSLGVSIGMAIATPSVVCAAVATVFAWIGWGTGTPGFALTAGILYAVAMALLFAWAMFWIVEMILCFVGYSKLKKQA